MANFKPIRSEGDYEVALHRISELMDTEADSPEGDELNVLVDLVKLYESKQVPMGYPSPVAALRSRKFSPASAQSPCRWRARCMSISGFRRTATAGAGCRPGRSVGRHGVEPVSRQANGKVGLDSG
ncbi:MAG: hypothetical protein OXC26_03975 [Albidovulum sp.]|nr:hypothetical protein [Albidovulum sp.]